jgi:UDP-N-acetylmuramate dehydrogenase
MADELEKLGLQLQESLGDAISLDSPLGALTTYRVGGNAAVLFTAKTREELIVFREIVSGSNVPLLVIGKGSNMLVADRGFDGVAIQMGGIFGEVNIEGTKVNAGSAVALPVLARRSVAAGLSGLEWAVGIPGTVGGAVRMNAGGHGAETSEHLISAELFSLTSARSGLVAQDQLDMQYRRTNVSPDEIVMFANFALTPGDSVQGEKRIEEIVSWRREHQPGGQNAGSVFQNPSEKSAGAYVDEAGLKGLRMGTAFVHEKHANFIQADANGKASDVYAVLKEVQRQVRDKFDVELQPEVKLIGFED